MVAPENLLKQIFRLLRNRDLVSEVDLVEFFSLLKVARIELLKESRPVITVPGIRAWFYGEPPTVPDSMKAGRFLLEFLYWVDEKEKLQQGVNKNQFLRLAEYLRRTTGNYVVRPRKNKDPQPTQEQNLASTWPGGPDMWKKVSQLAGTYQLIRPYTSDSNKYVLEVFSINTDAPVADEMVALYSHKQPKRAMIYAGSLSINNKYCFSTVTREHEDFSRLKTTRAIVLYTSEIRSCLSGLMLRGVSGENDRKMAIATPFFAIKSPYSAGLPLETDPVPKHTNIASIAGDLLIGEVQNSDKAMTPIFDFCSALFKEFAGNMKNENGISLQTVNVLDLCNWIEPHENGDPMSFFMKWKTIVESSYWRSSQEIDSSKVLPQK